MGLENPRVGSLRGAVRFCQWAPHLLLCINYLRFKRSTNRGYGNSPSQLANCLPISEFTRSSTNTDLDWATTSESVQMRSRTI